MIQRVIKIMFGFVFSQVNETYSERCLQISPARSLTLQILLETDLASFRKAL